VIGAILEDFGCRQVDSRRRLRGPAMPARQAGLKGR
jgi:hypothetical protein